MCTAAGCALSILQVSALKDQLKGERTQMTRKLGAMKEALDNVGRVPSSSLCVCVLEYS